MSSELVIEALRKVRFHFQGEVELQDGIERVLTHVGLPFGREVPLTQRDRIDFCVGPSLGIEVKIKGSSASLARQALRYARHPEISELIIVTTCARHRLPSTLNGKPVHVVLLESF